MQEAQALSAVDVGQTGEIPTHEFAETCQAVLVPINDQVSYFSVDPLDERELQRLVFDPVSALPPQASTLVPNLRLVLVPYLAGGLFGDDGDGDVRIKFSEPPDEQRWFSDCQQTKSGCFVFVAIRNDDYFDTHVLFYRELSSRIVAAADGGLREKFDALLDSELQDNVRGEVNETAWQRKRELLSSAADDEKRAEVVENYRAAALEDSLTLYLHGLCCDIDMESGPKQLASKHIRQRLLTLKEALPPPDGVALFPDEQAPAR